MCKSLRTRIIGGAAVGAALLLGSLSAFATNSFDCASGDGFGRKQLRVVGLTSDGQLVCFSENAPRRARDIGYVSGLISPDTALIGIDFRVQDGQLYGVGNGGGVYRIDTANAAATRVNSLTEALSGTSFGVDFNPAADRLRVVSNTGQNLRHNVNAGGTTIADGMLNYVAGTPATGIEGAAYTNNDLDAATITTLFDLDTNLDQIAIQAPPNNGSLNPTGKLNEVVDPGAGFDIYSVLWNGVTVANRGYAVLNVNGEYCFYRINLLTGAATYVGSFKDDVVVDIAIPLNQ
jgi:Domain of unknown function (DUF4394)